MRYLFINSVVDYGSTGKIVRQLANSLKEQGHDVLIAYGRNESSNKEDTYFFGSKIFSSVHLLATRLLGRHGLHSTTMTKKLIEQIESYNPDCIHLHNLHGYYLNVPLLFEYLKSKKDIKIIWTLHDCWSFSGSSAYFSFNGCKEWDQGCVVCNSTQDYPRSSLIKRQRKNFEWKRESFSNISNMTIITPSHWLKELVETTFLNQYDVKAIYNGLNLEIFKPSKNIEKRQKIDLLGVSNIWEDRKGLKDFILLRSMLPSDYTITLIGLSKDQIQSLPDGIKGAERTESVGELVRYYSNADIYLNFSVEETMGMTTIEAIACGTPSFVYDQTAVPEIVDTTVGKVFKAHDLKSIKTEIENFRKEDYPQNILVQYAKQYDESKMINNYIKEYKIYE